MSFCVSARLIVLPSLSSVQFMKSMPSSPPCFIASNAIITTFLSLKEQMCP